MKQMPSFSPIHSFIVDLGNSTLTDIFFSNRKLLKIQARNRPSSILLRALNKSNLINFLKNEIYKIMIANSD